MRVLINAEMGFKIILRHFKIVVCKTNIYPFYMTRMLLKTIGPQLGRVYYHCYVPGSDSQSWRRRHLNLLRSNGSRFRV